jgi:hypothetical protein
MASAVDSNIAAINQAAADSARMSAAQMQANTQIQSSFGTANVVNGASTGSGELAKNTGNSIAQAARAN